MISGDVRVARRVPGQDRRRRKVGDEQAVLERRQRGAQDAEQRQVSEVIELEARRHIVGDRLAALVR